MSIVIVPNVNVIRMKKTCKNCGYETHCDTKLHKDLGEQKEVLVCHHCRCDVCEKDYTRWSNVHDAFDDYNMYTDEAILTK